MGDPLRFRDDPAPEEPAVSLDGFLDQSNASTVRIEAGDDVRRLIPHIDRVRLVEIDFPKFRDGRGFSSATGGKMVESDMDKTPKKST